MQLSNIPDKLVLPWATSGSKNAIPVASQIGITAGAASLTDGFPPLTMTPVAAGGVPPSGLDMNGILYEMSNILRWANAGGGYVYDSTFANDSHVGGYPKGARVMRSDGFGYWLNTVDNNVTDPESAGAAAAGWVPDFSNGAAAVTMTSANITLTPLQYGKPLIVITGTLTGNLNLIFPAIVGRWVVINGTTGNYSITAKTAAGTGVVVPQGFVGPVDGDGVNIYSRLADLSNTDVNLGAALVGNAIQIVGTMATLRTIAGNANRRIQLLGFSTTGDGGGGLFYWNASYSGADDVGVHIIPTGWVGNGAWTRLTVNDAVHLAWFGPLGNSSTGDDATWQAALDYMSTIPALAGVQGDLILPRVATYLASPKVVGANVNPIGQGANFASQIVPLASFSGTALFKIDGSLVTGGWAFRQHWQNLLINCTNVNATILPKLFYINSAYTIRFTEVYVHNGYGTAFEITNSNDIVFDRPHIFGAGAGPGVSVYGIRCLTGSSVTLIDPDVEVWQYGLSQEADAKVTVLGHYFERNLIGLYAQGNTNGFMTVHGGLAESPGASGEAFTVTGANCTVIGGKYVAAGGKGLNTNSMATKQPNVNFIGVTGDISDPKNWATTSLLADKSGFHKTQLTNVKTLSDAVATTMYTITVPFTSSECGTFDLRLFATLVGYSAWAGDYRIVFTNPDGTPRVSAVLETNKTNYNLSGNYGLAVTVTATVSAQTIIVQVSADTSGALGAGMNCTVQTEGVLKHNRDVGDIYVVAN